VFINDEGYLVNANDSEDEDDDFLDEDEMK